MKVRVIALSLAILAACTARLPAADDAKDWVEPMKKVHAKFTGSKGTFAQFGDSITVTMAFWSPLRSGERHAGEPSRIPPDL